MPRPTLDKSTLQRLIPIIQAGKTSDGKNPTTAQQQARARAIDELVRSATGLILHIALTEHRIINQVRPSVTVEDLTQEGIAALMVAMDSVDASKAPLSYIGDWVSKSIRRYSEVASHDLTVPAVIGLAARQLAAQENAQSVTHEAVVTRFVHGSRSQPTKPTKGGTASNTAPTRGYRKRSGAPVSEADARAIRNIRSRLGRAQGEPLPDLIDAHSGNFADAIAEQSASLALASLVKKLMTDMHLGSVQREIIARTYGLPPHAHEHGIRAIATEVGVPWRLVGSVVTSFGVELTRPGGTWHHILARMNPDEIAEMGLQPIWLRLGPLPRIKDTDVDDILTTDLTRVTRSPMTVATNTVAMETKPKEMRNGRIRKRIVSA